MPIERSVIDEIRRLEKKIGDGAWYAMAGDMGNIHMVAEKDAEHWHNLTREKRSETTLFYLDQERSGDLYADFIYLLRNNAVAMLDEIERLREYEWKYNELSK